MRDGPIACPERLGGLLKYHRREAPPRLGWLSGRVEEGAPTVSRLERLSADILRPFVGRALGCEIDGLIEWDHQVLKGSWEGAGNLVTRVTGRATANGRERSWSLILKIPRPVRPEVDRWQREPLMYRSGVLDDLPGPLAAPRCLGVEEPPGDEPWIWMTDVAGIPSTDWPMERFYRALRHLGECQGAYLCGKGLPEDDWFDTSWWLRKHAVEGHKRTQRGLAAAKAHPVAARAFDGDRGKGLLALFDQRGALLDALERLPLTLTHGDLNQSNMIAPDGSDERTVVVDWHFAGSGAIGFDVVTLIACAAVFDGPKLGRVDEVTEPAIGAYLEGLRQSGWEGDDRLARFGCLGNLAVRITSGIPDLVSRTVEEGHFQIRDPQRLEERTRHYAECLDYLLGLAQETEHLLARVL